MHSLFALYLQGALFRFMLQIHNVMLRNITTFSKGYQIDQLKF